MSQYILPADGEGLQLRLGWDNPMMTFFGQVIRPAKTTDEEDRVLVWIGSQAREILTVEALAKGLAPYRLIPADVLLCLRRDRIAAADRGPSRLQRMMQGLNVGQSDVTHDGFAVGYHVFGQERNGEWFHHYTAPDRSEAQDEADGLLSDECKVQILRGPINIYSALQDLNCPQ